ncbi:T9SS type A sorting domain-containing protein [Haliscomenobacter sp.]|uniref:T9SS type A sorting domain-containing protein n=1 Tax=Haliscomenobacter sp. TaxID=2717303 RepID=UPI003593EE9F
MTKMLILILFMFCFMFTTKANDIILSKTGSTQLDGTYKPFVERNGAMSFIKVTEGVTFKISRFKLGWMISDSNDKEYFAVTDESTQIPGQGWDVGRAGVGLNVNFDLTFRASSNAQTNAFSIANTPSLEVRIYPNPTLGAITVDTKEAIQSLSLTNLAGQALITEQANRLDLSNLPSGIYNLTIQTKGGRIVKRIVKQ